MPFFWRRSKKRPASRISFYLDPCFDLDDSFVPRRAHNGDLGFDFKSPVDTSIPPHGLAKINTGIQVVFPEDYGMLLKTRSSMAFDGISVEGGVIDNQYRGMIQVILFNRSHADYPIKRGDKIAQGILVLLPRDLEISVFYNGLHPNTNRGGSGFGSTGK